MPNLPKPRLRRTARSRGVVARPQEPEAPNVEIVEDVLDGQTLRWINIERPRQIDRAWLEEHFDFHPLDYEDVYSRNQRPKVDVYDDYMFVVLHFPAYDKQIGRLNAAELDVFVGPDYVVTLPNQPIPPLEYLFERCRPRSPATCPSGPPRSSTSSSAAARARSCASSCSARAPATCSTRSSTTASTRRSRCCARWATSSSASRRTSSRAARPRSCATCRTSSRRSSTSARSSGRSARRCVTSSARAATCPRTSRSTSTTSSTRPSASGTCSRTSRRSSRRSRTRTSRCSRTA